MTPSGIEPVVLACSAVPKTNVPWASKSVYCHMKMCGGNSHVFATNDVEDRANRTWGADGLWYFQV
jgi:hypothetical protein